MMADAGLMDDTESTVVDGHLVQHDGEHMTVVACSQDGLIPEADLLNASAGEEPSAKRFKLDEESLLHIADSNVSIKQILFNINHAICLRLDAIENKLETVSNATKVLEQKLEKLNSVPQSSPDQLTTHIHNSPLKDVSLTTTPGTVSIKKSGAVVVGLPQSTKTTPKSQGDCMEMLSDEESDGPERYVVNLAGSNNLHSNNDQTIQNLGPNVTLITLNSEEDFPNGTWLGDESNPEMRVRVPVTPSDMLHIHSNCRTAEKMALTLLDYLFDRETQAYSNLSGMGKHGKKQLDPLMIYGIRCHLIHHFSISEQDWHRIKQNINSKCRTAFRRKVRGLPLTVKAFRGKAPPTYIHISGTGLATRVHSHDLGDTSDDSLQQGDDSELHIETEVDISQASMLSGTAELLQSSGGHIQVIHATPEQVAQLQQTHQIQILQGDQLLQFQSGGADQESIHVAVPMGGQDMDGMQVVNSESGETIHLGAGTVITDVTNDIGHQIPKVEQGTDSDQE